MFDFNKLRKEMRERATPEERARMDAYEDKEERYEATAREINASFAAIGERYVSPNSGRLKLMSQPAKKVYEQYVQREWQKPITMRIEDDIIRFIGASTGFERFKISVELLNELQKFIDNGRTKWAICGGSPKYYRCTVQINEVMEYLRDQKPELFSIHRPSMM